MGCGLREIVGFKDEVKLVTLDMNPEVKPDIVWDLNKHPLPFDDEEFDEIIALDVLEHLGSQGDFKFFFSEFSEYWRILKNEGIFHGSVPIENKQWAFGDPGHTRIFSMQYLTFLDQQAYEQCGITQLTDYRYLWKRNFKILSITYHDPTVASWNFSLQKVDNV